jgi:hypothetical protein
MKKFIPFAIALALLAWFLISMASKIPEYAGGK